MKRYGRARARSNIDPRTGCGRDWLRRPAHGRSRARRRCGCKVSIGDVDVPTAGVIEVIRLQHAVASDIAVLLGRLLDTGGAQGADPTQRVSVQAEPTNNALVVRASSPARVEQVKALVTKLDQPLAEATGSVHVVPLRNADAAALARTLAGIASDDAGAVGAYSVGQQRVPGAAMSAAPSQQQPASASPMPVAMTGIQGQAMVLADTATNSLIITAPAQIYRQLRAVIDKLDARRAQVFVECLIAEVGSDQAAEFGIQWQVGLGNINSSGSNVVGGTNFGGPTQNISSASRNLAALGQGLNVGVIKGTITIPGVGEITNITALARALESVTKANILSTPTLLTLDNEEAQILVGQNVPIVTGQYVTPGTGGVSVVNPFQTIQRQDIGITLRVRPQISEGGTIKLVIYQEVSSIQGRSLNTNDIILNKRSVETKALVDDGSDAGAGRQDAGAGGRETFAGPVHLARTAAHSGHGCHRARHRLGGAVAHHRDQSTGPLTWRCVSAAFATPQCDWLRGICACSDMHKETQGFATVIIEALHSGDLVGPRVEMASIKGARRQALPQTHRYSPDRAARSPCARGTPRAARAGRRPPCSGLRSGAGCDGASRFGPRRRAT